MGNKINFWYYQFILISAVVVPIITVLSSFFETTGDYVNQF